MMHTDITRETFDTLHRLAKVYPDLRGYFSSGTGGVDINRVVAVLAAALPAPRPADDVGAVRALLIETAEAVAYLVEGQAKAGTDHVSRSLRIAIAAAVKK